MILLVLFNSLGHSEFDLEFGSAENFVKLFEIWSKSEHSCEPRKDNENFRCFGSVGRGTGNHGRKRAVSL
jgi:hypothetical protein